MPTEVKQRRKKQSEETAENAQNAAVKGDKEDEKNVKNTIVNNKNSSVLDLRSIMCVMSLAACGALSWMVLQQDRRFSQMEEKYKSLQGKTTGLFEMEEEVLRVSKKLAASEDDLREALSAVTLADTLRQEISALHAAVSAMQADENSASRDLQTVNARFLNVTETWQERLAAVATDLNGLKSESRGAHAGATERVNEAERRARSLEERLTELEASTKRNARAMERTEEDDANRAQEHLEWNTRQIHKLEEQVGGLRKSEEELGAQLLEHVPRAKECEQHLPQVEEAVRSIVRLGGDLSAAEKRLEEVTLQVFGTEDSMLKALTEILEIRQELDTLQAQNSILKMKNELSVVKEAVRELATVLREHRGEGQGDVDTGDEEEMEEDEAWESEEEEEEINQPPSLSN